MVRCLRELLRRNPGLPPARVDDVAIAATTQIGDQGLTIGRTAALLAGLPKSVPGYAIDRMCAGATTAVTTSAGAIAAGMADVVLAGGVEHMGRHPMGEAVDPNPRILAERLVDPSALVMGATAENLHDRLPDVTRERADAFAAASQSRAQAAYDAGLARTGLRIDDIGAFEINEAFAVQVLAFLDHFGIEEDDPRVNPYGGAIAYGHPLASSGVRLMTQLARRFEAEPAVRYGITTMCVGIGMGGTVVWENPHWDGAAA